MSLTPSARSLAADVDVESAARAVTADIVGECWRDQEDPAFHVAIYESVHANLREIFDVLAGRRADGAVPPEAQTFAEVCAHLGIPSAEIEKCYRIGMASLWTRWCDVAWAHASTHAIPFDELIRTPTLMFHVYVDRVLEAVVARHHEVHAELTRTQRDQRRVLLAQILEGAIDHVPEELEAALGYSLGDTHLALLVETGRMTPPERELSALRHACDARAAMVLQHTAQSWIVWLGRPAAFDYHQLSRLRRALLDLPFRVAVGDPAAGIDGLRRTRDGAFEAARVQTALGASAGRCTWLSDVRLEALLLADERRAQSFVAAELGDLAADGDGTARLRDTLLTWLDVGSHVSAAAILGVHENTVRNRIRAAEELLGAPLLGHRTELQVALRLQRLLNGPREEPLALAVAA